MKRLRSAGQGKRGNVRRKLSRLPKSPPGFEVSRTCYKAFPEIDLLSGVEAEVIPLPGLDHLPRDVLTHGTAAGEIMMTPGITTEEVLQGITQNEGIQTYTQTEAELWATKGIGETASMMLAQTTIVQICIVAPGETALRVPRPEHGSN